MPKRLPDEHSIASMERLVSTLATDHAAGKGRARERVSAVLGASAGAVASPLGQEDARLVVALEHGFASWRQLVVFVARPGGGDFLRRACINYNTSDRAENYRRAGEMLAADASLGGRDIWHASCAWQRGRGCRLPCRRSRPRRPSRRLFRLAAAALRLLLAHRRAGPVHAGRRRALAGGRRRSKCPLHVGRAVTASPRSPAHSARARWGR